MQKVYFPILSIWSYCILPSLQNHFSLPCPFESRVDTTHNSRAATQAQLRTQWCIFLSQEVREKRPRFCCAAARVSPLRLCHFTRVIQNNAHKFTPLSILLSISAVVNKS